MKPHISLDPDPTQLEPGIVLLVQSINRLGLPTQYSCEGHRKQPPGSCRSPFPMVVVFPTPDFNGAYQMVRLMGMVGLHNGDAGSDDEGTRWTILPLEDGGFMLRPMSQHASMRIYRKGVAALVASLSEMDVWYNPWRVE